MGTALTKIEKYTALQSLELCIEMFQSPLARDSEEIEIDKVVAPALLKANKDLGFTIEEHKLTHLFDGIALEIKKNVPNIRLHEIPIAINKGVLGDYGEFYGLSVVTVLKFLKAHYTSDKRANLAKQVKPPEEEKQIPSEEEQKALAKIHLVEAFSNYKQTKTVPFSAVYLYRALEKSFKLVSYPNDVKFEMYYDAVLEVIRDKENESLRDPTTRLSNRKIIDSLKTLIHADKSKIECAKDVLNATTESDIRFQLKNQSERIALKRFFDNLIEMEQELTDLLTDESTF